MTKDFSKVPASAFTLAGGALEFAESGDGNTPVRMLVRSGQPIDHWFWGRIVHDLSGAKTHKAVLPIDYIHDEEIGFLNAGSQEITPDGLFFSGAIVPTEEPNDPARKVLARRKGGVPYEASINWSGDGSLLEQVAEGFAVEVNGYQFEGPGIVVREWPFRGAAVCPYGADMNTNSEFSQSNKYFSVNVKEGGNMPNVKEQTEAVAEVVETEVTPAVVETPAEVAPVVAEAVTDAPTELSNDRKEMKRFRDAFGAKGLEWFVDGLSFDQARDKQLSELAETVKTQAAKITELSQKLSLPSEGEASAVELTSGNGEKTKKGFASRIRVSNNTPTK